MASRISALDTGNITFSISGPSLHLLLNPFSEGSYHT
jgi:hypothetical protein